MTIHRDMFGKRDTGRCELCGNTEPCDPCTTGVPEVKAKPTPVYFKCEQCGCVCEELYRSKWEPTMCEVCEHGVFEFYGAVIAEGDTLGRDVRGEEGKVAEDIKNKKV